MLEGKCGMNFNLVGSRIKKAREKMNLTQEELAAMLDLSTTHISVIERGVKPPKLDTFIRIANALQVSADYLLEDVVNHSSEGVASELVRSIEELPKKEREKVLAVIRVMTEK